jgi:hypothetical protein
MSSLYIYIYTYECVSKLAQRPSGGLFLASVLRPDECQICFTASPQSAEFVVTRAVLDRFLCISPCSHLLPPALTLLLQYCTAAQRFLTRPCLTPSLPGIVGSLWS